MNQIIVHSKNGLQLKPRAEKNGDIQHGSVFVAFKDLMVQNLSW